MRYNTLTCLSIILIIGACSDDNLNVFADIDADLENAIVQTSPSGRLDFYSLPTANQYDLIRQDKKNKITASKAKLGQFLFFETGIALNAKRESGMRTYSCASCHVPEAGFKPGRMQGIADGGLGFGNHGDSRIMNTEYSVEELDIQSARPLSLVNVAYVKNTFWNGQFGSEEANVGTSDLWNLRTDTERNHLGFEAIETQNIEGIETHRFKVDKTITDTYGYTSLFDESFPEFSEQDRYTNFTASLALSAYIRTIISYDAPFQKWLKGDKSALSNEEKKGALLFFGKANCGTCHYNENLGSNEFHVIGANDMDHHGEALIASEVNRRNLGRGGFTLDEKDNYKFRVPGLYNLIDSPFYFHGSSKTSVQDVVKYKLEATKENSRVSKNQMSAKLKPIELAQSEIDYLVLFLEKSLKDSNLERYKPDFLKSGLCFPNNDSLSRIDLDCD